MGEVFLLDDILNYANQGSRNYILQTDLYCTIIRSSFKSLAAYNYNGKAVVVGYENKGE